MHKTPGRLLPQVESAASSHLGGEHFREVRRTSRRLGEGDRRILRDTAPADFLSRDLGPVKSARLRWSHG